MILINFISFQIGWFACVLGAAYALPWLGPLLVACLIGWHLLRSHFMSAELCLILLAVILGGSFDQFLLSMQWISYPASAWPVWLVPGWMLSLWAIFATTLNVSMRWMKKRQFLAVLFGGLGGPLAYVAAEKLGAITMLAPFHLLATLAVGWALMMPFLLWLSSKFDGYAEYRQPSEAI